MEEFEDQDDYFRGYDEYGDDYFGEEEESFPEYKAEMGAFERTTMGRLGTKISAKDLKGKDVGELYKILNKSSYDPRDRLALLVEAISLSLNDRGILSINNDLIQDMIGYINLTKKPEDLNSVGYVLGYMATNGGRNMVKTQVKTVIDASKKILEGGITPPDVVRYARYWINLKKQ